MNDGSLYSIVFQDGFKMDVRAITFSCAMVIAAHQRMVEYGATGHKAFLINEVLSNDATKLARIGSFEQARLACMKAQRDALHDKALNTRDPIVSGLLLAQSSQISLQIEQIEGLHNA